MNTSTPIISCPSREELDVFFAKTITNPDRLKVLEEHISGCEKCQKEGSVTGAPINTTMFFSHESQNETKVNLQADNPTRVPAQTTGNPSNQTHPADLTAIF